MSEPARPSDSDLAGAFRGIGTPEALAFLGDSAK
jgi:hypothetical protein